MKVALVYDRVVKFGGAERILLALKELWPDAPLYTALFDNQNAKWAKVFKVYPSFLNKIPFIIKFQELSTILTPFAFESFDFSAFDVVISISSHDAKSIITKPSTLHINYCLTPTRYLWTGLDEYYRQPALGILNPLIRHNLKVNLIKYRNWDLMSSARPDIYIAISNTVKKRIRKIYNYHADIIYPPLDTDRFKPNNANKKYNFFLIVSRLVPYKRIDYAILAFNKLKLPLKIIGSGLDQNRLIKLANKNIEFISGNLTDQKLCWYYQNCICLIFPGVEDFGLTLLEAQSCGKPVIALNAGGATESVIPNVTGILYKSKTEDSLIKAINNFNSLKFDPEICRKNVLKFSKIGFLKEFRNSVNKYYKKYKQQ